MRAMRFAKTLIPQRDAIVKKKPPEAEVRRPEGQVRQADRLFTSVGTRFLKFWGTLSGVSF